MGVRLVREVLDRAPADLTTAERLVLVVLAETANDSTRTGWPGMEVLSHRTGMEPDALKKVFQRLARRGLDPRVPVGKDTRGRPIFACRGHRTTYRIPVLPKPKGGIPVPPMEPERGEPDPTYAARKGGTPSRLSREKGGNLVPERGESGPRKGGRGSPPSPQEPSENRQQYARARVNDPDDDEAAILAEIRRQRPDASPALIRHIAREDGPTILAELRARQERERIVAAIADARRGPVCRHGTPGGEALHPVSGEPLCPMCRRRRRLASLPTAAPA